MQNLLVAIPSNYPGGLEAPLGAHFGHCDLYTLVKIAADKVTEVATLPNVPHHQGGCMAPVNHLAAHGVQVLIAGGMGKRPLMGFRQVGHPGSLRQRRPDGERGRNGPPAGQAASVQH
jgi:predicted Fe-Mo cluster-binding NifX family protein